jgi:hypothetical protein
MMSGPPPTPNLLSKLNNIANQPAATDDALRWGLREICHHFEWPVGHLYKIDHGNSRILKPANLWHMGDTGVYRAFRRATDHVTVLFGVDLPGLVLERGSSVWAYELADSALTFIRFAAALSCGIHSGAAFPLCRHGVLVGVVEFYGPEFVVDEAAAEETMRAASIQLTRIMERDDLATESRMANMHVETPA